MSKISKIKPKYQHRILKRPGSFQSHEKFLKLKMILLTKLKCKKSTNQQVLKNGQKNCWKKPGMIFEFISIFPMTWRCYRDDLELVDISIQTDLRGDTRDQWTQTDDLLSSRQLTDSQSKVGQHNQIDNSWGRRWRENISVWAHRDRPSVPRRQAKSLWNTAGGGGDFLDFLIYNITTT